MCNITFRPGLDFIQRFLVEMVTSSLSIILCTVITAIGYFYAVANVKKLPKAHFQRINSGIHKLLWYPTILFLVFLPSLVDHFIHVIDPAHTSPSTFLILHAAITHSIGFVNAIIYGLQKRASDYKRAETIVSLDGGSKQINMTELSLTSASAHLETATSRLNVLNLP